MSESTSACQAAKKDVSSGFASEFSMLSLLLAVCTAVNRKDVYPTFASSSEDELESWLWCSARKLDPYSTIMHAVIAILVLDKEILGGMAAGENTFVLTNSSCNPVVTHQDKEGAYKADMHGLNFATTSNLRNGDSVSELGYCTAIPDGIDYWASIKSTGDGRYVFRSEKWVSNKIPVRFSSTHRPVSLADHVTTVRAYLNDYRKTESKSDRANMSSLFSDYITTACWRKMYRQMTHWATLGLIRTLALISDDQLKSAVQFQRDSPDVFDGKPDSRLASSLISLVKRYDQTVPSALEAILAYHPTAPKELSDLLSQCHEESPVLYTQNTVEDFHHLLVASLIAYGSLLARIFDADGGTERLQLGTTVSVFARFLSTIVNSKAMTRHLRLLNLDDLLKLPTSTATKLYRDFAMKNRFGFGQTDDRGNKDRPKREKGDADAGTGPKVDGNEETPDEEDVDCWADADDPAAVMSEWMKTLTSHYSARQILERHCYDRLRLEEVKIALLTVNSKYQTFSPENMKLNICATLDAMAKDERPPSISNERTIEILKEKIEGSHPTEPHTKRMFWILKELFFNYEVDVRVETHCEMALAALSLYGHSAIAKPADKALEDLLKVVSVVDSFNTVLTSYAEFESRPCGRINTLLSYLYDIFTTFGQKKVW